MRMGHGVSEPARPFRARSGPAGAKGRKRAANVSVDAAVLAAAKAMNINLSAVLEEALRGRLREERRRKFHEESRAAIESYNRFIEENGLWGEEYRDW